MPTYKSNNTTAGASDVLPPGDCDFAVDDAEDKTSSAGNPMIEVQLLVRNELGQRAMVWDYLVFADGATWKIDHFRAATGDTIIPGQEVNFSAKDCLRRKGRCTLEVDTWKNKPKNKVVDYLVPKQSQPAEENQAAVPEQGKKLKLVGAAAKSADVEPDDIPF